MSQTIIHRRVCVFCASSMGASEIFQREAETMGCALAASGWGVVYGGANVGLMGIMADAALAGGAEVIGVIPEALVAREIAHPGLTELHLVKTMHERKALMASLADAFVALPGGYGTLDEFLEILTWRQMGIHQKPCVLVNTGGYYDHLIAFLDHGVSQGFLRAEYRAMMMVARNAMETLELIQQHTRPHETSQQESLRADPVG